MKPVCNPRFRSLVSAGVALVAVLMPAWAAAQATEQDMRNAGYLAANCANCHGTAGRNAGSLPSLAGMPAAGLAKAMRDFRDGQRKATVMHQLAKGYTDAQIDAMAAYFAAQPAKK